MRQRVVIALAICAEPELIIADEPTTALDVSVQAQIISLIKRLGRDHGTAVMLVTHDMGVIAETSDRVAVMYSGRIAEIGPVQDVVQQPAASLRQGPDGRDPDARRRRQAAGADSRLDAAAVGDPAGLLVQSALRLRVRPLPRRAAGADPRRARRPSPAISTMPPTEGDRGMSAAPFVDVKNLRRVFDVSKPWLNRVLEGGHLEFLKAVDGVTFDIRKGETFALVGESGSGKTTVARMVVGLLPPSSGEVVIDGVSMTDAKQAQARQQLRRRIQMIFQDPYASLNPRFRVDAIIAEPIRAFDLIQGERDIRDRVGELLGLVGLHPDDGLKYPHEFSGGQRQRIAIARALASEAEFIVCDEPTSALDVSVQAQILNLMRDLQDKFGLTYLFISHNLAVVRHMANRIGVMYLGRIVEIAEGARTVRQPAHALHQDAAGRGAGSRDVRPPADSGQGRNPEPDRSAARLRLQSALPAGVRSLPQGGARADRRRRLPCRQPSGSRRRHDHGAWCECLASSRLAGQPGCGQVRAPRDTRSAWNPMSNINPDPFTTRPEIEGTFGVVTSTHWIATAVGMGILEKGGNAFDAGVATAFTLQVVEPHLNGPGGDVPIIVHDVKRGRTEVICGQGPAPARRHHRALQERRPRDGARHRPARRLRARHVRILDAAAARLRHHAAARRAGARDRLCPRRLSAGRARRRDHPDRRAIVPQTLADLGRGLSAEQRGAEARHALHQHDSSSETYARILKEAESAGGDRVAQIERARKAWSHGFVAEAIDKFCRTQEVMDVSGSPHRGVLSADDMARWQPTIEAPLTYDYGRYTVCKAGVWSQGPVMLQQLALLKGFRTRRARSRPVPNSSICRSNAPSSPLPIARNSTAIRNSPKSRSRRCCRTPTTTSAAS